jgi:GTPase SAR1 family protein
MVVQISEDETLPRGLMANTRTVIEAKYRKPELLTWKGYPCIEAFPPLISCEEMFEIIQASPPYGMRMRKKKAHVRAHMVMDILHFFQPISIHARLDGMISRALHDGYIGRNPIDPRQADDMRERLEYFREHPYTLQYDDNAASGFVVIGMSGVGKSTSLRRILGRYPQIILHNKYRERKFTRVQITFIFLECPKDGSTKGLCVDFFKTIDFITGYQTRYASTYGRESRATNQLMHSMATVASTHQIGLIVVDEIQYLNVAKSGGEEEFLNFLVRLVNIIGVPVVLVGTCEAERLFSCTFREARRGSGQGDLFWEPLKVEDEDWTTYSESLWEYQYVANPSPLTKELSEALHDVSFGVIDIANRIYLAAQVKAIETKQEVITEGMLRSAYRDDFRLVSHIIETLKTGDPALLKKFKDVHMKSALPVQSNAAR